MIDRLISAGALACLGLGLLLLTHTQAHLWTDDVALWMAAVQHAPSAIRPRLQLGNALLRVGDPVGAAHAYRDVQHRTSPGSVPWAIATLNLALALERQGLRVEARAEAARVPEAPIAHRLAHRLATCGPA